MSFSIGRLGRVASVQDEVIIEWDEIANRPSLAQAFIAGENIAGDPEHPAHHMRWYEIAPGLWMLSADGIGTGVLIREGKEES